MSKFTHVRNDIHFTMKLIPRQRKPFDTDIVTQCLRRSITNNEGWGPTRKMRPNILTMLFKHSAFQQGALKALSFV